MFVCLGSINKFEAVGCTSKLFTISGSGCTSVHFFYILLPLSFTIASSDVVCFPSLYLHLFLLSLIPIIHIGSCPNPATCSGGKEWQDCGTACPLTCYNYNSTFSCISLCVPGCFCPQGTVDHNGECVNPSQCPGKFSNISTLQVCY